MRHSGQAMPRHRGPRQRHAAAAPARVPGCEGEAARLQGLDEPLSLGSQQGARGSVPDLPPRVEKSTKQLAAVAAFQCECRIHAAAVECRSRRNSLRQLPPCREHGCQGGRGDGNPSALHFKVSQLQPSVAEAPLGHLLGLLQALAQPGIVGGILEVREGHAHQPQPIVVLQQALHPPCGVQCRVSSLSHRLRGIRPEVRESVRQRLLYPPPQLRLRGDTPLGDHRLHAKAHDQRRIDCTVAHGLQLVLALQTH
mmetsp:Transcript_94943/g.307054  ORF Transcript_94943/g.307054 Transcript_94943/m.307054 type:complete len:254 (+) Transcript_94943:1069-1830(+)